MSTATSSLLLDDALGEGMVDADAYDVLSGVDLGESPDTGASISDIGASRFFQMALLVDDSSSIRQGKENPKTGRFEDNTPLVIQGQNVLIDSFLGGNERFVDNVLLMTLALNAGIIGNFMPIRQATRLSHANFNPYGGTPLRDRMLETFRRMVEKTQEIQNAGVQAQSFTIVLTDGADLHSKASSDQVRRVVESMLMQEIHVIGGVGIDDGRTDFHQVFREMGIPDQWILTPDNTPEEIRKVFQVLSQSSITMSQSGDNFSQMAGGGFAATS